jgi:hypothetical protein
MVYILLEYNRGPLRQYRQKLSKTGHLENPYRQFFEFYVSN